MSASTQWKILNVNLGHAPKLLIKSHFDTSAYKIQLTDLRYIWSEKLSKNDIIQRAADIGSSIDPSEDDEQFQIFLNKIQSALNREDGTSLKLHGGENDNPSLALDISAPLPHPLPAFAWSLNLPLLPPRHLEQELITPLLLKSSNLQHQIQHLVSELQDKDRVISKICDRLDTSGNDLTTVFPGVSNIKTSRKKSQREQLARHVKGLADFDEDAWRRQNGSFRSVSDDGLEMEEVLKDLRVPEASGGLGVVDDRWWDHLGEGSHPGPTVRGTAAHHSSLDRRNKTNEASQHQDESMPDDEFQRQGTPPHMKRQGSSEGHDAGSPEPVRMKTNEEISEADLAGVVDDESTTDDEDDLDAPPKKPQPSQRSRSPDKQTTKLGTLRGRLSPRPPSSAEPSTPEVSSPPREPRSKLGMVGGRSSQAPASSAKEPTPNTMSANTESKPRSKLGMIGGKSKAPASSLEEPEKHKSTSPPPPRSSKMGLIGGKKPTGTLSPASSVGSPKPSHESSPRRSRLPEKDSTPKPIETSQERADGKRDQLKRQLEEKASKAPAKKKRKF